MTVRQPGTRIGTGRRRRGFTLVEILVVIGIIVLLVGIGLPMLNRAMRQARITAMSANLVTIATALDAYKADHGDYPRVAADLDAAGNPVAGSLAAPNPPTGAQILAQALVGPAPKSSGNGSATPPTAREPQDGQDGPGFKTRRAPGPDGQYNTDDDIMQGRTYGPYVPADKFKLSNPADPDNPAPPVLLLTLLDNWGKPILYYPARPGANVNVANGYVAVETAALRPMFDAADNAEVPVTELRRALGDESDNGGIETAAGERARHTGPYILWSAGPDGNFGTSDDIRNFER